MCAKLDLTRPWSWARAGLSRNIWRMNSDRWSITTRFTWQNHQHGWLLVSAVKERLVRPQPLRHTERPELTSGCSAIQLGRV